MAILFVAKTKLIICFDEFNVLKKVTIWCRTKESFHVKSIKSLFSSLGNLPHVLSSKFHWNSLYSLDEKSCWCGFKRVIWSSGELFDKGDNYPHLHIDSRTYKVIPRFRNIIKTKLNIGFPKADFQHTLGIVRVHLKKYSTLHRETFMHYYVHPRIHVKCMRWERNPNGRSIHSRYPSILSRRFTNCMDEEQGNRTKKIEKGLSERSK